MITIEFSQIQSTLVEKDLEINNLNQENAKMTNQISDLNS